jgi:hypothetical protein
MVTLSLEEESTFSIRGEAGSTTKASLDARMKRKIFPSAGIRP